MAEVLARRAGRLRRDAALADKIDKQLAGLDHLVRLHLATEMAQGRVGGDAFAVEIARHLIKDYAS